MCHELGYFRRREREEQRRSVRPVHEETKAPPPEPAPVAREEAKVSEPA